MQKIRDKLYPTTTNPPAKQKLPALIDFDDRDDEPDANTEVKDH